MKSAKRLLMVAGAVALAGLFSVMLAPKAVHAVVATLVEVSNTPANPVPTSDVYRSAAQSVSLYCSTIIGTGCISLPPTGGSGTPYTVPAGQTLMVTDVEITTPTGGGVSAYYLQGVGCGPYCGSQGWALPNDGNTHQFVFPSGIPFPAGSELNQLGDTGYSTFVRGYLTSN